MKENTSAEGREGSYPLLVKLYLSIFWQNSPIKGLLSKLLKETRNGTL
ncbi:MAG: hypothetical protein ACI9SG_000386 [Maribacter sp.]|jgi:hypothetical protein